MPSMEQRQAIFLDSPTIDLIRDSHEVHVESSRRRIARLYDLKVHMAPREGPYPAEIVKLKIIRKKIRGACIVGMGLRR